MTELSREAQRAARLLSDETARKIGEAAIPPKFIATVYQVNAGAASDGNATVVVTYRGSHITAAGWNLSQTFAVPQRVMCAWMNDQVFVEYPIGGQP